MRGLTKSVNKHRIPLEHTNPTISEYHFQLFQNTYSKFRAMHIVLQIKAKWISENALISIDEIHVNCVRFSFWQQTQMLNFIRMTLYWPLFDIDMGHSLYTGEKSIRTVGWRFRFRFIHPFKNWYWDWESSESSSERSLGTSYVNVKLRCHWNDHFQAEFEEK